MFNLPTNKQENETREQSSQNRKPEPAESEIQEFARKLDQCFARATV